MGTQTHLPPKFSFSSDFGHFIFKMVENAKFSSVSRKKDAEISSFHLVISLVYYLFVIYQKERRPMVGEVSISSI